MAKNCYFIVLSILAFNILTASFLFAQNNVENQIDQLYGQAQDAFNKKQYQAGIGYAITALALADQSTSVDKQLLAGLHHTLGKLYYATQQYDSAYEEFKKSKPLVAQIYGENSKEFAYVCSDIGDALLVSQRFAEAEDSYKESLNHLHDEGMMAISVYTNLAKAYEAQSKNAETEQAHLKLIELKKKVMGENSISVATSFYNLANLQFVNNNTEEAQRNFLNAIGIAKKIKGNDDPFVAQGYLGLAQVHSEKGHFVAAEKLLQKSLKIFREKLGEDNELTGATYLHLGILYWHTGRFSEAEVNFQAALSNIIAKYGEDAPGTAMVYLNLAALYNETGRSEKALPYAKASLQSLLKSVGPDHFTTLAAYNVLGMTYLAVEDYQNAAEIFRNNIAKGTRLLGPNHPFVLSASSNLATIYFIQGDYEHAEPLLLEALKNQETGVSADQAANLNANIAEIYFSTGRYNEAETAYKKSVDLSVPRFGDNHPDTIQFRFGYGRVLYAQDKIEEAREQFDRLFDGLSTFLLKNVSAGRGTEGMKFLSNHSGYFMLLLRFYLEHGSASDAYDIVAFYKGLYQDLAAATKILTPANDAERNLVATYEKLTDQASKKHNADFLSHSDSKTQNDFEKQLNNLDASIATRIAAYHRGIEALRVDSNKVKEAIPANAVFLDYFAYTKFGLKDDMIKATNSSESLRYVVFVVRNNDIQAIDLGQFMPIRNSIADTFKQLALADYKKESEQNYKTAANLLYQKVFAPVKTCLEQSKHIIVGGDSNLTELPFGILVDDAGNYLTEVYTLSEETSARQLVRAKNATAHGSGALLIGDPDYDMGFAKGERPKIVPFARLKTTRKEVERAAKNLKTESIVLTGQKATESAFKNMAPGRNLLLFTTHGYYVEPTDNKVFSDSSENPLARCGLALCGANVPEKQSMTDDGILTGLEVVNLDLSGVELVVLSACETANGKLSPGQGVLGMRYAFTVAGAQSVAATAWSIPIKESGILVDSWIPHIAEGDSPAEGLQKAQIETINAMRKKHGAAHPYFWGAFTVSGRTW